MTGRGGNNAQTCEISDESALTALGQRRREAPPAAVIIHSLSTCTYSVVLQPVFLQLYALDELQDEWPR